MLSIVNIRDSGATDDFCKTIDRKIFAHNAGYPRYNSLKVVLSVHKRWRIDLKRRAVCS